MDVDLKTILIIVALIVIFHKYIRENLKSILNAILLVVLFHSFLYKPFVIPSESMVPTMLIGDYLFVSKYPYGYSKNSFYFSPPVFSGRVLYTPPKTGDVAVFRMDFPGQNRASEDWIKRVIGVPGDKIQMRGGKLFINGQETALEKVGPYKWKTADGEDGAPVENTSTEYIETLPNGVKHRILKSVDFGAGDLDNTKEFVVPADHFFMMGDNRDHSGDSRRQSVGFIHKDKLIGRAEIIFFSTAIPTTSYGSVFGFAQFWKWPTETRFSRFFNIIK